MEDISIKRTVIPHFNFRDQTLKFEELTNGYMNNLIKQEIDFKNQTTQKALIALGWTPPPTNYKPPSITINGFEEDREIERCAMAIVNSVNEKVRTHPLIRQETNDENFDITIMKIKELINGRI